MLNVTAEESRPVFPGIPRSDVVHSTVHTHLGAPETMVNGFAGAQVAEIYRAPVANARGAKKRHQSRRLMLSTRP